MTFQPDLFAASSGATSEPVLETKTPDRGAPTGAARKFPRWLGLVTSHRRLFDAGQDGWFRSLSPSGFVLGCENFQSEDVDFGGNIIPVRLAFTVDRMPFPERLLDWSRNGESKAVRWRAPLPLYAVEKIETPVARKDDLASMANRFSNISLPVPIKAVDYFDSPRPPGELSDSESESLELPESLNAVHGAMAMAVWAVPHIAPWVEILMHALIPNADEAAVESRKLDARWLRLPWLDSKRDENVNDQEALWRAAVHCMQWSSDFESKSPAALAENLAREAHPEGSPVVTDWLNRTRRIDSAEESISPDVWRENPAGLAIQLALFRSDPLRFGTWPEDLPQLPPAVWWAAATLCGWRHGYRALDKYFRGDSKLQEFLATRALAVSWPGGEAEALPPSQRAPLERRPENGAFVLAWNGHAVIRKEWKSRAKWLEADLSDERVSLAARELADQMKWPCVEQRWALPKEHGPLSDEDIAEEDASYVFYRPPVGAYVEERFDAEAFRRCLAVEPGDVPDPPKISRRQQDHQGIPGLVYEPDFLTEAEEKELLRHIYDAEWSGALKSRRVQHYGYRYDYKQRHVDDSARLGDLPEWAERLARRLVDEGLMPDRPDQVIVNEYEGKQGISKHIDQPQSFGEHVATISLLETWGMVFRRTRNSRKEEIPLERRSVAVMSGEARYKWTHEIPARQKEKGVPRGRRLSLTFRTVLRRP